MKIRRQSATFQLEEDAFKRNAEGISKFFHELLIFIEIFTDEALS